MNENDLYVDWSDTLKEKPFQLEYVERRKKNIVGKEKWTRVKKNETKSRLSLVYPHQNFFGITSQTNDVFFPIKSIGSRKWTRKQNHQRRKKCRENRNFGVNTFYIASFRIFFPSLNDADAVRKKIPVIFRAKTNKLFPANEISTE